MNRLQFYDSRAAKHFDQSWNKIVENKTTFLTRKARHHFQASWPKERTKHFRLIYHWYLPLCTRCTQPTFVIFHAVSLMPRLKRQQKLEQQTQLSPTFFSRPRKHKKPSAWINQTLLYLLVGHCTWALAGAKEKKEESNVAPGWGKTVWTLLLNNPVIGMWNPSSPLCRADTVSSMSESEEDKRREVGKSCQFQMKHRKAQSERFHLREDISQMRHCATPIGH